MILLYNTDINLFDAVRARREGEMTSHIFTPLNIKAAIKAIVTDGNEGINSASRLIGRERANELLGLFLAQGAALIEKYGCSFPHDPQIEKDLLTAWAAQAEEDRTTIEVAISLY